MTCYARYRLPYSDHYTTLRHLGSPLVLPSLEALDGRQGFVIAPFRIAEDMPLVLIPAEDTEIEQHTVPNSVSTPTTAAPPIADRPSPAYADDFRRFSAAVRNGQFAKLVLSRTEEVALPEGLDTETLFYRACHTFPRAMVMLFSTPLTGTWLVCSPEILIDFQPPFFCTMALAGTMPHSEGLPTWSAKNQSEQHIVEQYIADVLAPLSERIIKDGPRTVQAGSLMHLRTDFRFSPRKATTLGLLLQKLHPTPAVCGLPKQEALDFIHQNETTDRRYYSGFAGPLNICGETHLYVTLRCLEIAGSQVFLHAGGGIMPDSVLEEEWRETCHKMLKTLLLTPPETLPLTPP